MVTRLKILVLFVLTWNVVSAQDLLCGTQAPTLQQQERLNQLIASEAIFDINVAVPISEIAIVAHVIRRSDGTGGLTETQLNDALDNVNDFYSNANMSFFFLDINYIDEDKYFSFVTSDEAEMTAKYNYEGVINIYFAEEVGNGSGGYYCGYAYFPGGADVILMANSCTTNGSTLPHEIGHFFFLYHTHGTTNTGTTDELVIRPGEESVGCVEPDCTPAPANCDTNGDRLCDTEADPNVSGKVNGSDCSYTENETDVNGDAFRPDPTNIMSYSTKACRTLFSDGQYSRMNNAYLNDRNYLHTKRLLASFEILDDEVCMGESVSFSDKSINASSYSWTFDGGSPSSSTEANPQVVYANSGLYDVTLTITDVEGDTHTKSFSEAITVREDITSDVTAVSGSFESDGLAETIISNGSYTWTQTTDAATEGTKSAYIFHYTGNTGDGNYLVLDPLKTDVEKYFSLTFDYAFAAVSDDNEDKLEVIYRSPCGDWTTAWEKSGQDLATAPNEPSVVFVPTESQWVSETVLFAVDNDVDVVEVAFRSTSDYGNSLYVDNYAADVYDANFSISEAVATNASCPDATDGSISISVSASGTYEYSIDGENFISSNVIKDLLPGTYDVLARSSLGVEAGETVVVGFDNEYPEVPSITLSNDRLTTSIEDGQSVQWYRNEEPIAGETGVELDLDTYGSYQVEISNGSCSVRSEAFIILSADVVDLKLDIFPNPADDYLTISLPESLKKEVNQVTISDLSGKQIKILEFQERLDVSTLQRGLYLIHFELDGENINRRFLKQ